jgi:chaperonin GroES
MKKATAAETKKSSKVHPLADRVLIRESKSDGEKRESGIIIPETVKEDRGAKEGVVVAVGEGKYEDGKLIPMKVSVGDTVLYQWGDELKIGGEEFVLVSESNILAIVK